MQLAGPPFFRESATRIHVLLVEDDSQLRALLTLLLEDAGYAVAAAGDAHGALALLDQHAATIRALVTDLMLPDVNGAELARHALELIPTLAVVYVSGYTRGWLADDALPAGHAFLTKPFSGPDLASAIELAIEARLGVRR
jgi:CheY-like chemotaxis protein